MFGPVEVNSNANTVQRRDWQSDVAIARNTRRPWARTERNALRLCSRLLGASSQRGLRVAMGGPYRVMHPPFQRQ